MNVKNSLTTTAVYKTYKWYKYSNYHGCCITDSDSVGK